MNNSIEINHKELKAFIKKAYETKLSLNLTGTVGIGKSIAVFEVAKEVAVEEKREFIDWNRISKNNKDIVMENPEKYFLFMDIRLSQKDSTDLQGLPNIGEDKKVVEWLINNWLFVLTNPNAKGIVFFDEMNLAPPSVQASAYQIIRDKCMGDVKLSDDICIISAGNTLEDRANVFEMAKPLCNRFIHATLLPPSIEEWSDWANEHDVDNRIIAYLQYKPDELFMFNPDSPENTFPTPRAWAEFVSPLIKGLNHNSSMFQKYVASAVGSGIAIQFTEFQRLTDTIDFKKILKNPILISQIEEFNIQWSLVALINSWFDEHHKKEDCELFCELIQHLPPEFAILCLRTARKKHKKATKEFSKVKLWTKTLVGEYGKYLLPENYYQE